MNSDRTGASTDGPDETQQHEEQAKPTGKVPPDKPGEPGYPSRAESRRAAIKANWKSGETSNGMTDDGNPADGPMPSSKDGDEPGSWRGEAGQYLNAEENLATDHAVDRIREKEPGITEDLKAIEAQTGGRLVGLEYRLKGEGRFKEKVSEDTRDHPELSIGEIAASKHDAIRYTYRFDKDEYVDGYRKVCRALEGRGYELRHSRNFWSDSEYKGINTRWSTPEGQLFEVQFHTPESFAAKQETHAAYERLRNLPEEADDERAELSKYQRDVTAGVPAPNDIDEIENYRKG